MLTHEACAFHDDVAVYRRPSPSKGEKEEEHIVAALGGKKAVLLPNKGLLTCGQTVEAATYWLYALERCCQSELLALGVPGDATTTTIDDEDAALILRATERRGWGGCRRSPCLK